jgi:hypothetical protein
MKLIIILLSYQTLIISNLNLVIMSSKTTTPEDHHISDIIYHLITDWNAHTTREYDYDYDYDYDYYTNLIEDYHYYYDYDYDYDYYTNILEDYYANIPEDYYTNLL